MGYSEVNSQRFVSRLSAMLSTAVEEQIERLFFICQGILSDQTLTKNYEISLHGWLLLYISVVQTYLLIIMSY